MPSSTFGEFWPSYVRAHSKPRTRLLHATGSALAVILFGAAFAVNMWLLAGVPIAAYAFAWYSHVSIERNPRAMFRHPFLSLFADYRMLFLMMAGRMDEEVAKYSIPAASGPVSPAGSPVA